MLLIGFYLVFKNSTRNTTLFHRILGWIGLIVLSIGIIFKIQHWPGAYGMMLIGESIVLGLFLNFFIKFKSFRLYEISQGIWLIIIYSKTLLLSGHTAVPFYFKYLSIISFGFMMLVFLFNYLGSNKEDITETNRIK